MRNFYHDERNKPKLKINEIMTTDAKLDTGEQLFKNGLLEFKPNENVIVKRKYHKCNNKIGRVSSFLNFDNRPEYGVVLDNVKTAAGYDGKMLFCLPSEIEHIK